MASATLRRHFGRMTRGSRSVLKSDRVVKAVTPSSAFVRVYRPNCYAHA